MIHDHFSKWKVILQKILQTQWTASASINLLILKKQLLVTSWSKGYVLWWSCWRQRPRWCCRYQWYNAGQGRVRMMKICISSLEHCYCCLRIHYCSDADIPEPGSVTESCYCSIRDEFLIFFTSLRLSTKNFSIFSSGSGAVTREGRQRIIFTAITNCLSLIVLTNIVVNSLAGFPQLFSSSNVSLSRFIWVFKYLSALIETDTKCLSKQMVWFQNCFGSFSVKYFSFTKKSISGEVSE